MIKYFLHWSRHYEQGFEAFETKEQVIAHLKLYGYQPDEFTLIEGKEIKPKQVTKVTEWEL